MWRVFRLAQHLSAGPALRQKNSRRTFSPDFRDLGRRPLAQPVHNLGISALAGLFRLPRMPFIALTFKTPRTSEKTILVTKPFWFQEVS